MSLDCRITESLQKDFSSLWRCERHVNTLEISTPYLMPDSTLLSLLLTEREGRYIVCDGGRIWDLLNEYCSMPIDEASIDLRAMAASFKIKEGSADERPIFFKDCTDLKLISSLVFDIANFSIMATSALVSSSTDELPIAVEHRFETRAEEFVKIAAPDFRVMPRSEIAEVPGVRFNAVLRRDGFIWLLSYVNGSTLTKFRQSLCDTLVTFRHANESATMHDRLRATIPIVNNEASGYDPDKLRLHFTDLKTETHDRVIPWTNKDRLTEVLRVTSNY